MNTKMILTGVMVFLLAGTAFSQSDTTSDSNKKIIRKERKVVVVDGDKVTINGVPADQLDKKELDEIQSFKRDNGNMAMMAPGRKIMIHYNNNKAFLGVQTQKDEKGARIIEVTKESAAEKAGLKVGDIIISVNEIKIEDGNVLREAIGKFKPEEKVKIGFIRDGKSTEVTAILGKYKAEDIVFNNKNFNFNFPKDFPGGNFKEFNFSNEPRKPRLGLQIQDLEEGNGVKITDVDDESPAEKAGLKENDVISEIDGKEIKDVDDLRNKIKDIKEGDSYKIKYKRDGKSQTAEVKIPKKLKTANL
jgi:serine protease Do